MPDLQRVEDAALPPGLRAEHAKLMSSPMWSWPADLTGFVSSLPPANRQVLADRVGAWLYSKGGSTGA
jgi:hypothetical protein